MAAGLGFKTFTSGEVLTAANVNGYLMQGINVFASTAARDAAITAPAEGQFAFTKDTNGLWYYDGAAWVASTDVVGANPNLVINGNFTINQRGYVSAANLASGSYGFDRWKSNFTNTTLTYTSAPAGQSVTINSGGGLQQIVEQADVPAGTYVLSFTGTATGRIYNSGGTPPSYAASPITFTADGLANVVVEFTASGATKTLSKVKLELASSPTAFCYAGGTIQGELAACQRYFSKSYDTNTAPGDTTRASSVAAIGVNLTSRPVTVVKFPVTMRTTPTMTIYAPNSGTSGNMRDVTANANVVANVSVMGDLGVNQGSVFPNGVSTTANNLLCFHYTADSEL
jgi:hypothetical protein